MKRVVVLPLSEAAQFPDLEVIAMDRSLAAFVGNTTHGRTREAYDSEDSFLEAVAQGFADRYTFSTLDEAATFAQRKLDELARAAQKIEHALGTRAMQRRQPKREKRNPPRMTPLKKNA
jgi:hypothetical protein